MSQGKHVKTDIIYEVRRARAHDFYKGAVDLLSLGFTTDVDTVTAASFTEYIAYTRSSYKMGLHRHVFVIEDEVTAKIVATATVLVEKKLIHGMRSVAHIEDVVVHPSMRKKSLGKLIIDYCVRFAEEEDCYKCILDCSEGVAEFYEKCDVGFNRHGVCMATYL